MDEKRQKTRYSGKFTILDLGPPEGWSMTAIDDFTVYCDNPFFADEPIIVEAAPDGQKGS